jgi:hypothetical protein
MINTNRKKINHPVSYLVRVKLWLVGWLEQNIEITQMEKSHGHFKRKLK